jgi:L-alanine-DL-glutamate epimerase-like enolase superfamily enzyme
MKITAIELYHVSVPLKETFWPTWIPGYPQTHNRFTLIKIVTDEGIEGYSTGSAMGKESAGLDEISGIKMVFNVKTMRTMVEGEAYAFAKLTTGPGPFPLRPGCATVRWP